MGIVEVKEHPNWMFKKLKNDTLREFVIKHNKPLRRQDLPKFYNINDALYVSKTEYFENVTLKDPIFDIHSLMGLEMNYLHSFDINTEFDFRVAKSMLNLLKIES